MAFRNPRPVLFLALMLTSCGGPDIQIQEAPAKPVKLVTLSGASAEASNSLPAVVRSVRTTDLAFQVGGRIIEWNAQDGAAFARGQVLARLDPRSFEAAVAQAEARYRNADSEYQRAVRLIEEDAISRSVVESRLAQRQIAEADLDTARKNLEDTVLRAPFTGFVGRTEVEQFQNVGPQQTVLVLQSRSVEAVVNVPASFVLNANRVRYLETYVELDAAPGRRFPAQFRDATGQADSSTQTFEGHFTFNAPSDLLVLTGMTATLYFEAQAIDVPADMQGVAVPLGAILSEGETRYVWVASGRPMKLAKRRIELGQGVGDTMVAKSGLKPGETIVAAGGAYLKAGDTVRPWGQ